MRLRRSVLIVVASAVVGVVASTTAAQASGMGGDCYYQNGQLVGVPWLVPSGATADATPMPSTGFWEPGTWFDNGFTTNNPNGCMQMRVAPYTWQMMSNGWDVQLYTLQIWNNQTGRMVWQSDKGFSDMLFLSTDANVMGVTRVWKVSQFLQPSYYYYDIYNQRTAWQSDSHYPWQAGWHGVLRFLPSGDLVVQLVDETSPSHTLNWGRVIWDTGTSCRS
jgi:hypothetical protein